MTHSYDREKDAERPVRLDRTEGHIIIEGRTYPAKEIVEALAQSGYVEMRAVGDSLVLGRRRITPIFKSRQERAMAALCHGSLAYCCPLSKRCAQRDRALEILGLTVQDYQMLKGDAHHKFISTAKGAPIDHSYRGHQNDQRMANQPAVDRGFGSEDYRRDFDTLDRALQSSVSRTRPTAEPEPWFSSDSRRHSEHQSRKSPFSDIDLGGHSSAGKPTRESKVCSLRTDDSIEGIGSLFQSGELSPFSDDDNKEADTPSFCFSCGRTIQRGVSRCPYCGVTQ